ncbi:dihydropyrimidinase [soil metagenome]
MGASVAIRGGEVVSATGRRPADVFISGERIVSLSERSAGDPAPGALPADLEIDASGCYVIPGAVDVHTHLDMEAGAVRSADDFATGTIAAACGGTTTVVDFATAHRGESAAAGLAKWHDKARGKAVVDYAFHLTVCELSESAEDLVAGAVETGVTSFKLYMTYPERLMVGDDVIRRIMRAAAGQGVLVALHCEDDGLISGRRKAALEAGNTGPRWHAWTRPPEAEARAVGRAVRMAELTGCPMYVVHLSSADALAEVRAARERGLPVWAETCPQYLYLTNELYGRPSEHAASFLCAPPLRSGWHREELWEGLAEGHLQVVSTDHCPFDAPSRRAGLSGGGWRDFTEIPGGLPGLETRLSLVYQRVVTGELSVERWVALCCTTPARLFGLAPAKGELVEGADADVVVFDPRLERPLARERLHMRGDSSPYEDLTVTGWPAWVLARGRVVARGGEPVREPGHGRFVARGPSGAVGE